MLPVKLIATWNLFQFLIGIQGSTVETSDASQIQLFPQTRIDDYNSRWRIYDNVISSSQRNITALYYTSAFQLEDAAKTARQKHLKENCSIPEWELPMKVIAISTVGTLGVVGNALSFSVLQFSPIYRHKSYAYYLRALAVFDSLNVITNAVKVYNEYSFKRYRVRLLEYQTMVTCKLGEFVHHVIYLVSSWLVACFSFDRYVAVCHPLYRVRLCTRDSHPP